MSYYKKYIIGTADYRSTASAPIMDMSTHVKFTVNPSGWDEKWIGGLSIMNALTYPTISTSKTAYNQITLTCNYITPSEKVICDSLFIKGSKIIVRDDQNYIWEAVALPHTYRYSRRNAGYSEAELYTLSVTLNRLGEKQTYDSLDEYAFFISSNGNTIYNYNTRTGEVDTAATGSFWFLQKIDRNKFAAHSGTGAQRSGIIYNYDGTQLMEYNFSGMGTSSYHILNITSISGYYYFAIVGNNGSSLSVYRRGSSNTLASASNSELLFTDTYTGLNRNNDVIITKDLVIYVVDTNSGQNCYVYNHSGNEIISIPYSSKGEVVSSLFGNSLFLQDTNGISVYNFDTETIESVSLPYALNVVDSYSTTYTGVKSCSFAINNSNFLYNNSRSSLAERRLRRWDFDNDTIQVGDSYDWTNNVLELNSSTGIGYASRISKNLYSVGGDISADVSIGSVVDKASDFLVGNLGQSYPAIYRITHYPEDYTGSEAFIDDSASLVSLGFVDLTLNDTSVLDTICYFYVNNVLGSEGDASLTTDISGFVKWIYSDDSSTLDTLCAIRRCVLNSNDSSTLTVTCYIGVTIVHLNSGSTSSAEPTIKFVKFIHSDDMSTFDTTVMNWGT